MPTHKSCIAKWLGLQEVFLLNTYRLVLIEFVGTFFLCFLLFGKELLIFLTTGANLHHNSKTSVPSDLTIVIFHLAMQTLMEMPYYYGWSNPAQLFLFIIIIVVIWVFDNLVGSYAFFISSCTRTTVLIYCIIKRRNMNPALSISFAICGLMTCVRAMFFYSGWDCGLDRPCDIIQGASSI